MVATVDDTTDDITALATDARHVGRQTPGLGGSYLGASQLAIQQTSQAAQNNNAELMIDSGAATHVCPTWFAPDTPLYTLQEGQGPQLRTATDGEITALGNKWVHMQNQHQQPLVVPFFVCDVKQPIMSVTRLAEQGFNIQLNESASVTHPKGFNARLKQTRWPLLPSYDNCHNTSQHDPWSKPDNGWNNRQDSTSHTNANRQGGSEEQERPLDSQHTGVPSKSAPHPTKNAFHARWEVPKSNRQAGKLQTYNSAKSRQQQWRLRRNIPRSQQTSTEKGLERSSMERRNLVQNKERNTSPWQHTTTTSITLYTHQSTDDYPNRRKSTACTYTQTHYQEANNRNQSDTIHEHPASEGCQPNIRLLDKRRSILEKSTCTTKKRSLHPTTDKRRTRCQQTWSKQTIDSKASQCTTRLQIRRWLDNTTTSHTWQSGQALQTLKSKRHTRMSSSRTTSTSNKKQEGQKDWQHHGNQHHKKDKNTN